MHFPFPRKSINESENINYQFPSTKGTLYKVLSLMGTSNRFPTSAESENVTNGLTHIFDLNFQSELRSG